MPLEDDGMVWDFGLEKQLDVLSWCLMIHASRSIEDRVSGSELNCGGLAQEFSEKNNINICCTI